MGTKLRRFSTNTATKVIAFILVIVSITTIVYFIQSNISCGIYLDSFQVKEYKDSEEFKDRDVARAMNDLGDALNNAQSNPYVLAQKRDYLYFVKEGKKKFTNTLNTKKSFFAQYDNAFYALENGVWSIGKNTNQNTYFSGLFSNKCIVYIAFDNQFMKEKQQQWDENKVKSSAILSAMIAFVILTIFLIIFLICVTGRRPKDKELHLSGLDKIYSDVLIFSIILCSVILFRPFCEYVYETFRYDGSYNNLKPISVLILSGFLSLGLLAVFGLAILSIVRKIKARKLLTHSLIFVVVFTVYDFCRSLFDGRKFAKYPLTKSLFYRQVVFIVVSSFLVFLTLSFIKYNGVILLPPIIEVFIIYWYIKGNNKTFEDINKGSNESLEDQMRAERMKIALVTNVSHDLKTPLTSIISYVDLLSKEEDLSEVAKDYVKILSEKSDRLKNIVSDLFDLAKSTSGNIALDLENLDMKKLIEQTLADMEDEIEKSGLQIKTKLPQNPVNIVSDGKKLYRVFQNVIDNALKYSLSGTRVFVELEQINGMAIATIKNTASYEMDFSADDILQRFNRGDKSRTSEGSGLGLSIAESFTSVCGGSFKVDIDGDLFKVTISFKNNTQIAE